MIRFALVAALGAIGFGCAMPEPPQAAGASAAPRNVATNTAPMPIRSRAVTGSRLAPLDIDDPGPAYVGAVSGDDWRANEATRVKILCGEDPSLCANNTGAKLR